MSKSVIYYTKNNEISLQETVQLSLNKNNKVNY